MPHCLTSIPIALSLMLGAAGHGRQVLTGGQPTASNEAVAADGPFVPGRRGRGSARREAAGAGCPATDSRQWSSRRALSG